ncbi:hypothetical protein Vafri_13680 [Volvox africanus]|uniref:RHOMBOID-like protein n=1 Tax=Volvox africanus TaxID=51714 RepID=A0A8J4F6N4_9CHLO|nr:hypothetical protein Vafri_13680 [Volvox africanus]
MPSSSSSSSSFLRKRRLAWDWDADFLANAAPDTDPSAEQTTTSHHFASPSPSSHVPVSAVDALSGAAHSIGSSRHSAESRSSQPQPRPLFQHPPASSSAHSSKLVDPPGEYSPHSGAAISSRRGSDTDGSLDGGQERIDSNLLLSRSNRSSVSILLNADDASVAPSAATATTTAPTAAIAATAAAPPPAPVGIVSRSGSEKHSSRRSSSQTAPTTEASDIEAAAAVTAAAAATGSRQGSGYGGSTGIVSRSGSEKHSSRRSSSQTAPTTEASDIEAAAAVTAAAAATGSRQGSGYGGSTGIVSRSGSEKHSSRRSSSQTAPTAEASDIEAAAAVTAAAAATGSRQGSGYGGSTGIVSRSGSEKHSSRRSSSQTAPTTEASDIEAAHGNSASLVSVDSVALGSQLARQNVQEHTGSGPVAFDGAAVAMPGSTESVTEGRSGVAGFRASAGASGSGSGSFSGSISGSGAGSRISSRSSSIKILPSGNERHEGSSPSGSLSAGAGGGGDSYCGSRNNVKIRSAGSNGNSGSINGSGGSDYLMGLAAAGGAAAAAAGPSSAAAPLLKAPPSAAGGTFAAGPTSGEPRSAELPSSPPRAPALSPQSGDPVPGGILSAASSASLPRTEHIPASDTAAPDGVVYARVPGLPAAAALPPPLSPNPAEEVQVLNSANLLRSASAASTTSAAASVVAASAAVVSTAASAAFVSAAAAAAVPVAVSAAAASAVPAAVTSAIPATAAASPPALLSPAATQERVVVLPEAEDDAQSVDLVANVAVAGDGSSSTAEDAVAAVVSVAADSDMLSEPGALHPEIRRRLIGHFGRQRAKSIRNWKELSESMARKPPGYWLLGTMLLLVMMVGLFFFMAGQYDFVRPIDVSTLASGSDDATALLNGDPISNHTWGPPALRRWMIFWRSNPSRTFSFDYLRLWGGRYTPDVQAGQWWRWVTSLFVHQNSMHLAANMALLLVLSVYLESLFGFWLILPVWVVAGIAGNMASAFFENTCMLVVGSSGAIFGLLGTYVADAALNFESIPLLWLRLVGMAAVAALLVALQATGHSGGTTRGSSTSHASHVGGFLAGGFLSVLMVPDFKAKRSRKVKELLKGLGLTSHLPEPTSAGGTQLFSFWQRHKTLLNALYFVSVLMLLLMLLTIPVILYLRTFKRMVCG